jgi:hypothetical protein
VKPSLIVEVVVVVDELQEELVGAITIGSENDSSIISHVMSASHDTTTFSFFD